MDSINTSDRRDIIVWFGKLLTVINIETSGITGGSVIADLIGTVMPSESAKLTQLGPFTGFA